MSGSGGLLYHLRAARFGRRLWSPFRTALDAWLARTDLGTEHLVLVGPSAGYCLTDGFLGRFARIDVLEPDPVARFLLGRRLARMPGVTARFVARDLLVAPLLRREPGLPEFLAERPGASVLFANLLGQMRLVVPADRFEEWQAIWPNRVAPELAARPWASFHDRVSSSFRPLFTDGPSEPARVKDQDLGSHFYAGSPGRIELFDHSTENFFPGDLPHAYFHWHIAPDTHHLIEAVASPAAGSGA
jgi:hypothetical protein